MKVVIDTNCLLSCIGKKSPYRNVFDAFIENRIIICASSEMLLEYEEIFTRFWGSSVSGNLLGLFESSDNFHQVTVHYNWRLINKDEDDNKFVDTFIASEADVLISNDSSITSLVNTNFPPLRVMTLQQFSNFLNPQ
jgi:uncharacterized protein